jgi:NADP-dependent 3-hydroxy acid dehydrogenase YdfG
VPAAPICSVSWPPGSKVAARVRWFTGWNVGDTAAMNRATTDFVERASGVDVVIANAGMGIPSGILAGKAEPTAHRKRGSSSS